jgi:hypothetical protein
MNFGREDEMTWEHIEDEGYWRVTVRRRIPGTRQGRSVTICVPDALARLPRMDVSVRRYADEVLRYELHREAALN